MKKRMRKFWEATFESFETLFVRKWKKYLVKRQLHINWDWIGKLEELSIFIHLIYD